MLEGLLLCLGLHCNQLVVDLNTWLALLRVVVIRVVVVVILIDKLVLHAPDRQIEMGWGS